MLLLQPVRQRRTNTDGLDFALKYTYEWAGSLFTLNESATRLLNYTIQVAPGQPSYDAVGRANLSDPGWPTPRWRNTLMLGWIWRNLSAQITQRFTSGVGYDFNSPPPKPPTAQIGTWAPIDWQLSYKLGQDGRYGISVGMINAFNRQPPFAPFNGYIPELSDALGRQMYVQLSLTL